MLEKSKTKNWMIDQSSEVLHAIHNQEVNIAIWERKNISSSMQDESLVLIESNYTLRSTGSSENIRSVIDQEISSKEYPSIHKSVSELLMMYKDITGIDNFRLLLTTVNSNMCRRFHTDVNDIRLLCTLMGQGTLWLPEHNVNREALNTQKDNEDIVIDSNYIMQVPENGVVLLKGALYPKAGTQAIVHRSPTIEESGEKRLLLRIDTNDNLNFG